MINEGSRSDVWIVDASFGGMRPLTTSGDALAPEWTPEESSIL